MSKRPATGDPYASTWGAFALVTYLPDPLGSFLTGLRQMLSGDQHPDAHITFLPPRLLTLPLDVASAEIRARLTTVTAFELELGHVDVFPETNMLYLTVESGHNALLNLHNSLNDGGLFAEELFDYIPHLTLSGPLTKQQVPDALQSARTRWSTSGLSPRFVVEEMVMLWQPGHSPGRDWNRQTTFCLANGSASAANQT